MSNYASLSMIELFVIISLFICSVVRFAPSDEVDRLW